MPFNAISSTINFNAGVNYSKIPGLTNGRENHSDNVNTSLGITLASNISETLDFSITSRSNFNVVNNSAQSSGNSNYYMQNTRLKVGWIFGPGIILRSDLVHEYYKGLTDGYNENYWMWSASIGKKIFKNQRGEISIVANDILDQNVGISRNVSDIL